MAPFRRFWGNMRRKFMQRLFAALHGTLNSYLRDALQEGSADVVACLHVPRACVFSSSLIFAGGLRCFYLSIFSVDICNIKVAHSLINASQMLHASLLRRLLCVYFPPLLIVVDPIAVLSSGFNEL
jgi:hypothetical protein